MACASAATKRRRPGESSFQQLGYPGAPQEDVIDFLMFLLEVLHEQGHSLLDHFVFRMGQYLGDCAGCGHGSNRLLGVGDCMVPQQVLMVGLPGESSERGRGVRDSTPIPLVSLLENTVFARHQVGVRCTSCNDYLQQQAVLGGYDNTRPPAFLIVQLLRFDNQVGAVLRCAVLRCAVVPPPHPR